MSLATSGGPHGLPEPPSETARTLEGLRVQGRVIHALLLRELNTRFGRGHLGFLWLFLEPLMLSCAIGLMHVALERRAHLPVPIFLFYCIGYSPYFAFRAIINRAPTAFAANMTLMYHRPVKLLDIMIARNLLEMGAVAAVITIVVAGAALLSDYTPHSVAVLVSGLLLMFALASGIGMLVAAGSARWEVVERIIHPLTYISLPFSAAFYALHYLPERYRSILAWSPQANLHEMIRDGMFGGDIPCYYDLMYITWWVIGANLLGIAALRAVRTRLEF